MREECIPLDAPAAWINALKGIPHAFGHTWENCYAMYLSTGHNTFLYTFELDGVRIICPIAERSFHGFLDIVTPYGFSGFVGNLPCQVFTDFWKQFVTRRGYVCGYIALNPFFDTSSYYETEDAYAYNCVYALNLTMHIDELFSRLSKNRKRQVLAAHGMTNFVFDKGRLVDFLLSHYRDFYRKKGASTVYQFAPETLIELEDKENVILTGTEGEGEVNAVMMFAYTPYVGEYVLNISRPIGVRHSVALLWNGIKQLKAKKVAWLNLGGGIRPHDGVAQFKERFGGTVLPLLSLKQIYDHDLFRRLCQKAHVNHSDLTGYFPPYRAKLKAV
jgi:hypothetical protein